MEIKNSALDIIVHARFNGNSVTARRLQNQVVFKVFLLFENQKIETFQKKGRQKKTDTTKSRDRKKIGPEKMKTLKSCFDPLERRGIPDLVWVATGDEF